MVSFTLWAMMAVAFMSETASSSKPPPVQGFQAPKHNTGFQVGIERWRNRGCMEDKIGARYFLRDGDCFSASDGIPFRGFTYEWKCPKNCGKKDIKELHKMNCGIVSYAQPNCDLSSALGTLFNAHVQDNHGACANAGGLARSVKLVCEKLEHSVAWPSSSTWNPYTETTPSTPTHTLAPWQTVTPQTVTVTVPATTVFAQSAIVTVASTPIGGLPSFSNGNSVEKLDS
ncbi:hypothetical protein HII31_12704 [Pseudocercospora fuligena]|uniref:Uncharacterized protein n=1 Tax=Pseudocercospora fuligena TaxID=685502 RepID=A0A8H6R775_9PEZI|nr:hypothetical protein HII31_12704 [Pseudocercospora fuligena]